NATVCVACWVIARILANCKSVAIWRAAEDKRIPGSNLVKCGMAMAARMLATEIAANVSSKLNPAMPRCAVSLDGIIELFDARAAARSVPTDRLADAVYLVKFIELKASLGTILTGQKRWVLTKSVKLTKCVCISP